jgi:hypothetical protein
MSQAVCYHESEVKAQDALLLNFTGLSCVPYTGVQSHCVIFALTR